MALHSSPYSLQHSQEPLLRGADRDPSVRSPTLAFFFATVQTIDEFQVPQ